MKGKYRQLAGFTLVELIVVMVIGLFLMAGMFSFFQSNKQANASRHQLAQIEDLGRNAIHELTRTIQHAGYRGEHDVVSTSNFITGSVTGQSCSGNGVATTQTNVADASLLGSTVDGLLAANDQVGVVYSGDSSLNQDCSGLSLPSDCEVGSALESGAAQIYSTFSIGDVSGVPHLQCASSLSSERIALVPGIERIQFNYGVDADNDGVVDQYQTASQVTQWGSVLSVRVALLARSLKPTKKVAEAMSFMLLDNKIDVAADRYQRAVFQTTIRLQNVNI
ncbi:MAG: Unknown protein [uncultured Thiotrichaceae bacterium]|uniref:Type IV fimbrial biogenesis protein PilW n=1 Tax=uncultured Thiotrichaceae bacterium TaxID=298394 RepID=A0A6S6SBU6_9GAMM|nr:MAG: Unknown protein [uncultured Thiotrichaceae bacterium]